MKGSPSSTNQGSTGLHSAKHETVPNNDKLSHVAADIQGSEHCYLYLSLQSNFMLHMNTKHLLHSFAIPHPPAVQILYKSREVSTSFCSRLCQELFTTLENQMESNATSGIFSTIQPYNLYRSQ